MHHERTDQLDKPRDLRRHTPTFHPYCVTCGAKSGHSHDQVKHTERLAAVLGIPNDPDAMLAAMDAMRAHPMRANYTTAEKAVLSSHYAQAALASEARTKAKDHADARVILHERAWRDLADDGLLIARDRYSRAGARIAAVDPIFAAKLRTDLLSTYQDSPETVASLSIVPAQ